MSEPQRQLALGAADMEPTAPAAPEAAPVQSPSASNEAGTLLPIADVPQTMGDDVPTDATSADEPVPADVTEEPVMSADAEPEPVPVPARISLRQGREARGWSLEEAARRLRLSVVQVEAIERRDWASLPAQAYCQGFIKNYARLVDLDPSDDLSALSEHYRQLRPSDLLRDDPTTLARYDEAGALRNKTSANPVLIGGAVLLAVLAVGIGVFGDRIVKMTGLSTWMAKSETIVLPPKATVESVPVTPTEAPANATAPGSTNAATATPPAPEAAPVPVAAAGTAAGAAAAPPVAPAVQTPALSVAPVLPAAAAPSSQAVAVPGERRVRLVYRADAWVEIRDASGSILVSQLNRAGSEQVLSGKPPLRLVIGSADGVSLEADGKAVDLTPYKQANVARMTLN